MVERLVVERCSVCHGEVPSDDAPMSLVSLEDFRVVDDEGRSIAERVLESLRAGTMPPRGPVSEGELAAVEAWVEAGLPGRDEGEACPVPEVAPPVCEPDLALRPATAIALPDTPGDTTLCFGITIDEAAARRHVTAVLPAIEHAPVVHHLLVYETPAPVPDTPYPCLLTPADWRLLYAWGPGTGPYELPPEAGLPLEAGAAKHFAMQLHYQNAAGAAGITDRSGVDLCTTTDLRPHDAAMAIYGGVSFPPIPPQGEASLDCRSPVPAIVADDLPVTIFQSWPHMHRLGRSLSASVEHTDGTTTPLVTVEDYDFEHQITYPSHVELNVGDVVRTRCRWQNLSPDPVTFGDRTEDEMCFNFVTYYPAVPDAPWFWTAPALIANCSP
ncbi:MAG: hypothetical protein KC731_38430 [Myxococcales bacterium]|nr:hypothetical protein [Myxococcales bacterium]